MPPSLRPSVPAFYVPLICLVGVLAINVSRPAAAAKPSKPAARKPEPSKPVAVVKLPSEVRAERIDAAMKKAIEFLYSQNGNGNWEVAQARDPANPKSGYNGQQWTGLTALTVYALISAGEPAGDKHISAAISFLMAHPSQGVYASCCRCLVWSRLTQTPAVRRGAEGCRFTHQRGQVEGRGRRADVLFSL